MLIGCGGHYVFTFAFILGVQLLCHSHAKLPHPLVAKARAHVAALICSVNNLLFSLQVPVDIHLTSGSLTSF